MPKILGGALLDWPPVIPDVTVGAFHTYRTPEGTIPSVPLVGETKKVAPLQTSLVISLITGTGLMDTVKVKFLPTQLPADGVRV